MLGFRESGPCLCSCSFLTARLAEDEGRARALAEAARQSSAPMAVAFINKFGSRGRALADYMNSALSDAAAEGSRPARLRRGFGFG